MGSYVPIGADERAQMLADIGISSLEELYARVPPEMLLRVPLDLPQGLSEMEVRDKMTALAGRNRVFHTILRGAGAYDHYIPAIVKSVTSKETFVTAYTPYQAEVSQGILQSIFEYQSMICALTGMDVANASVYDGGSACAEALTTCRDRRRTRAVVCGTINPRYLSVLRTYSFASGTPLTVVPAKDGLTSEDALREALGDGSDVSCVLLQSPNFYGLLEDAERIAEIAHSVGAKCVFCCNPIALALYRTPGEVGADVAVGEGQPLGLPLGFGGPYLGFMAARSELARKLPGRIVGETVDREGRRGYVLTLQAREQHIRREKASSNICSNEALCALTAAVYLSAMGAEGLREVAGACVSKAHYLASELCAIPGVKLAFSGEFFHEFLVKMPGGTIEPVLSALADEDILGGLPVEGGLLFCVTEKASREALDKTAAVVRRVLASA